MSNPYTAPTVSTTEDLSVVLSRELRRIAAYTKDLMPISIQEIVVASGGTAAIKAGVNLLLLLPAGVIATQTITMPSHPIPGWTIRISSSRTVTALTVSGVPTAPASVGPGSAFYLTYSKLLGAWTQT